ncbi:hypothetical protein HYPSUDRAFT_147696, partial [Hypholoma sublateritium FD-334 SS-4]
AHVELAERMKQRATGSAPALCDRVAYVITKSIKGPAAWGKSEHPLYALENMPIDTKYCLGYQVSKPLLRIFEPILGNKAAPLCECIFSCLLYLSKCRFASTATPTVGGLTKFTVKTVACLVCSAPMHGKELCKRSFLKFHGGLNDYIQLTPCENCKPRMPELYQNQISTTSAPQARFSWLWTQCQRCQGSLHQDGLCTSKDSSIFCMRKEAQKDVEDANKVLERFDGDDWQSAVQPTRWK